MSAQGAERRTASIRRRGIMLVLSSPSGAGKSTTARNLLAADPTLELSVSVTTRARRGAEVHGQHYHFVSVEEFMRLRDRGALLEWAEVHGNFYATPRAPAESAMAGGRDMLFDIDWQGAVQLAQQMRADIVSVFILPPSMRELQARLRGRAEDSPASIDTRLRNARDELEHWREYDYVVVNEALNNTFEAVRAILTAERLRRDRRPGLFDFVSGLLDERLN